MRLPFLALTLAMLLPVAWPGSSVAQTAGPAPAPAPVPAIEASPASTDFDARLKRLEEELRCLVCQNQTLADSPSEWADGMRREIRSKMEQGLDNDQIIQFLVERYGDFVTYKPPLKPSTYVLWFGPVLVMLIALLIVGVYVRKRSRPSSEPEELDAEAEKRARELLDDHDNDK